VSRPNKQNPDSGIETGVFAACAPELDLVQTNRIPTQGLKRRGDTRRVGVAGSPNKQNPDSGIETPTTSRPSCARDHCPNKQNPDSGIETTAFRTTVLTSVSPNKQNPDSGIETSHAYFSVGWAAWSKQTESRLRD